MPRSIVTSLLLNYVIMGGVILLLATWLIDDSELWSGFVVVAAVPLGFAVVPLSYILGGNTAFSLIGLVASYLAALVVTPAIMVTFLGIDLLNPIKLLLTLGQLIVIPLVLSRILLLTGLNRYIARWEKTLVSLGFFVVIFTIIGLNRNAFFEQFDILLKASIIAFAMNFILGYAIELIAKAMHIDHATNVSLTLIGSKKNTGLASVIALTSLTRRAAIPGAVSLVFTAFHTVWLMLHFKKSATNS